MCLRLRCRRCSCSMPAPMCRALSNSWTHKSKTWYSDDKDDEDDKADDDETDKDDEAADGDTDEEDDDDGDGGGLLTGKLIYNAVTIAVATMIRVASTVVTKVSCCSKL